MTAAFVGIGANLGDRGETMRRAVVQLQNTPGVGVEAASPVYETAPVGVVDQPEFLNAVLQVETGLTARALLDCMLGIERNLGRVRKKKWGPRTLDLDLLLFGDAVIDEPGLTVPHPLLHERGFVLVPLCDLAPGVIHPVFLTSVGALMASGDFMAGLRHVAGLDLMVRE